MVLDLRFCFVSSLLFICSFLSDRALGHDLAAEMKSAATTFIDSLEPEQRKALQFEFDNKFRKDWQFIPMQRQGIGFDSLNHAQRYLAMSLLQTTLSHRGFDTSMKIMALEQVLFDMERTQKRDAGKYHLFVFGQPDQNGPWGGELKDIICRSTSRSLTISTSWSLRHSSEPPQPRFEPES